MKRLKGITNTIKWFLYQEQSRENLLLWFIGDIITTFFM